MLSASMNAFYGGKQITGNGPAEARTSGPAIAHPKPDEAPARLTQLGRGRAA
jgi:hypothetical protein